jgi:hypothetical protein
VAASAVVGVLVTLSSGCARLDSGDQVGGIQDAAAQRAMADGMAAAFRPSLTVHPSDGTSGVSPGEPVTAAVASGQITQAELKAVDGGALPGVLSPDGARWSSTAPLKPNTSYLLHTVVRATSGQETPADTRFSTLAPGQQVTAVISPKTGEQANPASPISVVFSRPVTDHAAVERSLVVTSTPALPGSTHWRGDRELVWQADGLWQAGTRVTATLDFFGRKVGPGVFGGGDVRSAFHVGSLDQASSEDPADTAADTDLPPDATDPSLAEPAGSAADLPPGAAPTGPRAGTTVAAPNAVPGATAPGARAPGATTPGAATGSGSTGAGSGTTPDSRSGTVGNSRPGTTPNARSGATPDTARSSGSDSADHSDDQDSGDDSDSQNDDRGKPKGPSLPVLH